MPTNISAILSTKAPAGPQGPQGPSQGLVFRYDQSSTVASSPSVGYFKLNSTNIAEANQMYVSFLDSYITDRQSYFNYLALSNSTVTITLFQPEQVANVVYLSANSYLIVDESLNTGQLYANMNVAYISGTTEFTNDSNVVMAFSVSSPGVAGPTGPSGPPGGPQGPTGPSGPSGPLVTDFTSLWSAVPDAPNASGTAGTLSYDAGGSLYLCLNSGAWFKFFGNNGFTYPIGNILTVATTEELSSATDNFNTVNKVQGLLVFNATDNKVYVSSGSSATSVWYVVDGSSSITPA